MQPGARLKHVAFGGVILFGITTAASLYFLVKYQANPFELDLLQTQFVGLKLRVPYYATIISVTMIPLLVFWATAGTRHRVSVSLVCVVIGLVIIAWSTQSVLHIWAELGGKGLP